MQFSRKAKQGELENTVAHSVYIYIYKINIKKWIENRFACLKREN